MTAQAAYATLRLSETAPNAGLLYLHEPEPFDGIDVLDEIAGPMGLLLWQTLRDLNAWLSAGQSERMGPRSSSAHERRLVAIEAVRGEPNDFLEALRALASVIALPELVEPRVLLLAALRVSHWAEERGAGQTARAYARTAARIAPGSAGAALRMGRLAQRRGEPASAEVWLRQAVTLGRSGGEKESIAAALLSLGQLYRARGNGFTAERCYRRALRLGRRYGPAQVVAESAYELFQLCAAARRPEEAVRYARVVVESVAPDSDELHEIATDVAEFWLRSGHFARALPVLTAVLGRAAPELRTRVLVGIVRAAGALGRRQTFDEAWNQLGTLGPPRALPCPFLLDMARGAMSIGDWDRSRSRARHALGIARLEGDPDGRLQAETLLLALASRPADAPRGPASADAVVGELVHYLSPEIDHVD